MMKAVTTPARIAAVTPAHAITVVVQCVAQTHEAKSRRERHQNNLETEAEDRPVTQGSTAQHERAYRERCSSRGRPRSWRPRSARDSRAHCEFQHKMSQNDTERLRKVDTRLRRALPCGARRTRCCRPGRTRAGCT
jgi:hypothetical protein